MLRVDHSPPDADDLALLSAFLDGELSSSAEAAVLEKLSLHPALQDTLDALADQIVCTQRLLHSRPSDAADHDDAFASTLAAAVMSEIDPAAMPDSSASVEFLSHLVVDAVATHAQAQRLDQLLDNPAHAATAIATATATDFTRAAVQLDAIPEIARSLQGLSDHVFARVERTERAWALGTGAIDAQLSPAQENELVGWCGADADIFSEFGLQARQSVYVAEALRAAADSPAFLRLAEKAGAAALQAISATELLKVTQTKTPSPAPAPSWFERWQAGLRPAFAPLIAASAAAALFVVIAQSEPPATTAVGQGAFAEVQKHFLDVMGPVVLANNRSMPTAELSLLRDNAADVQAIDATGTTMVFSTAESNITVIWVAGLEDEQEQGT